MMDHRQRPTFCKKDGLMWRLFLATVLDIVFYMTCCRKKGFPQSILTAATDGVSSCSTISITVCYPPGPPPPPLTWFPTQCTQQFNPKSLKLGGDLINWDISQRNSAKWLKGGCYQKKLQITITGTLQPLMLRYKSKLDLIEPKMTSNENSETWLRAQDLARMITNNNKQNPPIS